MVGFEMALAWEVLLYHVPPLHGGRKAGALHVWANSYITLQLPQQTTDDCERHMTSFSLPLEIEKFRTSVSILIATVALRYHDLTKGDSRKRLMRASKSPARMASRSDTHPAVPSG